MKPREWNATEAVYAFAGWLTSRKEPVTISAVHNAAQVAALVDQFVKANDLPKYRNIPIGDNIP